MSIDLMCTVNLKHFGHVCTQALELIAHTVAAVEGFQTSNSMVGGVSYTETEIQTNSPKVNLYYIAALQTTDCAQLVPKGTALSRQLLSRSSLQWCQVHRGTTSNQEPRKAQSTGVIEALWKAGRDHGGSDDVEIMKKKTAAVVWLGWCVRCRQQPQWDRMQIKQGAGTAKLPWKEGELGMLGLEQQWVAP